MDNYYSYHEYYEGASNKSAPMLDYHHHMETLLVATDLIKLSNAEDMSGSVMRQE